MAEYGLQPNSSQKTRAFRVRVCHQRFAGEIASAISRNSVSWRTNLRGRRGSASAGGFRPGPLERAGRQTGQLGEQLTTALTWQRFYHFECRPATKPIAFYSWSAATKAGSSLARQGMSATTIASLVASCWLHWRSWSRQGSNGCSLRDTSA